MRRSKEGACHTFPPPPPHHRQHVCVCPSYNQSPFVVMGSRKRKGEAVAHPPLSACRIPKIRDPISYIHHAFGCCCWRAIFPRAAQQVSKRRFPNSAHACATSQ